jgi:hypothetical protein
MDDYSPRCYSFCPGAQCDVRELCARNTPEHREPCRPIDFSTLGPAVTRTDGCSVFVLAREMFSRGWKAALAAIGEKT